VSPVAALQRSASFEGRVSTTIVAMWLILVTGRQKCNKHSPFGSACSNDGASRSLFQPLRYQEKMRATVILCVRGSHTSIREDEAVNALITWREIGNRRRICTGRSVLLSETVTKHSGITTISKEKAVKLVEDGGSDGMFLEQVLSQETAYLTRLVKIGAIAVIEKVVA
jgi:hypothetical protein